MARSRFPALSGSIALIAGSSLALNGAWCPIPGSVLLLAMGMALRGTLGGNVGLLALGLALGAADKRPDFSVRPEAPIEVGLVLEGRWQRDVDGLRSAARGQWVRQGLVVSQWNQSLRLSLPRGAEAPETSSLRVRGFLRRAAATANGVPSRPGPWILRAKSTVFVEAATPRQHRFWELWHRAGNALVEMLEVRLTRLGQETEPAAAALVRVLILGDSSQLPGEVRRGLRSAGLAHLVALSGLHVGLLIGTALMVLFWAPLAVRLPVALVLALGYVVLAGARPSLVRATLMMSALFVGWLLRRPPQPLNVLAWVSGAMVLYEPQITRDLGFQLTVVATAGILVLSPHLEKRWTAFPDIVRRPLSVSVAAHIAVLPWSLSVFHLATPWSPLWNLLMVPWAGVSLACAFFWALASISIPIVGDLLGHALEVLSMPLMIFGSAPPQVLGAAPVSMAWWVSSTLALLLALLLMGDTRMRLGSAVVLVVMFAHLSDRSREDPELILLDVGQGEAILLRDRGESLLIDGGGWRRGDIAQRILLPSLTNLGVSHIEGMILSHPDQDHCDGLLSLVSFMRVKKVYLSAGWFEDSCAFDLMTRAGPQVRVLWRNENVEFGRWRLHVVHPAAGDRVGRNSRSLVLFAEAEGLRVLLTGDLEAAGERRVMAALDSAGFQSVDILKVGHHGSNTSTTGVWLERLQPRLALISSGLGNRYGHPDSRVLKRLRDRQILTLRTDRMGAIRIAVGPGGSLRIGFPGQPLDRRY